MEKINYTQYLLNNYHPLKKRINYIENLLSSTIFEKTSDTIEELNYKREGDLPMGRSPWKGDNTGNIALIYEEKNKERNRVIQNELQEELKGLKFHLRVLEEAVKCLPKDQDQIITWIYFENKARIEISRKLFISENTLHRRKRQSVKALSELISIIL